VCGNCHGLVRKYGINCCRQCFRSYAKDIGFQKVCPHLCCLNAFSCHIQYIQDIQYIEYIP